MKMTTAAGFGHLGNPKAQYYEFLSVRERVTLEGELIRWRPSGAKGDLFWTGHAGHAASSESQANASRAVKANALSWNTGTIASSTGSK